MSKTTNIRRKASAILPTKFGTFQIIIYKSLIDNSEHTVLLTGDIQKQPLLTRVHSQCLTGDTFYSLKCDCGDQLRQSMQIIAKEGDGIIIYLNQEGRGIGLLSKINAYALQEKGLDTVEANHALGMPSDARDYNIAAEILYDLNISKINLLTNNPQKIKALEEHKIKIVRRIPIETMPQKHNLNYLATKKKKLGHLLSNI